MKLTIKDIKGLTLENCKMPKYDIEKVKDETKRNPIWLHFGAGNIFRGYIARLQQNLLDKGLANKGIIAAETFDYEIIEKIYNPHDNLTLLATLSATKPTSYEVIASIVEGVKASTSDEVCFNRLKEIFRSESLQMVSFTITEKGYQLNGLDGKYSNLVKQDIENGPTKACHAMSILTALLFERFACGAHPVAIVSMDNCSHNGEKIEHAVLTLANEWLERGFVTKDFIDYLKDESKVTFPWSMIDKITPRPAKEVEEAIIKLGFEEMDPITTSKNTFIAPYVNAEVCEYLVIEDKFPNGRPALENAGVYLTDRETVNKVETMKVTTCLNPLHTALAVYGCLLGFKTIASEMEDRYLSNLVSEIGAEGMKVVVDPKILSPQKFLDEVLNERLPNKSIPDMPERIATDTSQKIPVRYGETIKAYVRSDALNVDDLTYIPLAIAGWLRYLLAKNDKLEDIQLSSDPMLATLQDMLKDVKIGSTVSEEVLSPILSNEQIFGIDLTKTALAKKVTNMFNDMIQGEGAVLKTLKKYLD